MGLSRKVQSGSLFVPKLDFEASQFKICHSPALLHSVFKQSFLGHQLPYHVIMFSVDSLRVLPEITLEIMVPHFSPNGLSKNKVLVEQ